MTKPASENNKLGCPWYTALMTAALQSCKEQISTYICRRRKTVFRLVSLFTILSFPYTKPTCTDLILLYITICTRKLLFLFVVCSVITTPWRNGSASDSRSEGCVFESRRGQDQLFCFMSLQWRKLDIGQLFP